MRHLMPRSLLKFSLPMNREANQLPLPPRGGGQGERGWEPKPTTIQGDNSRAEPSSWSLSRKESGCFNRGCRGVTLIELIAFIVIASVVATAMLHVFSSTMRGSYFGKEMTQGAQLAQQRMEVIYGQRKTL